MRFRITLLALAVFSIFLTGCSMENKQLKGDRADTQGSMKNNTTKDPTVDEGSK